MPNNSVTCYVAASEYVFTSMLTDDQKITLCQGATSTAPVDCYVEAIQNPFSSGLSRDQKVTLCRAVPAVPQK